MLLTVISGLDHAQLNTDKIVTEALGCSYVTTSGNEVIAVNRTSLVVSLKMIFNIFRMILECGLSNR